MRRLVLLPLFATCCFGQTVYQAVMVSNGTQLVQTNLFSANSNLLNKAVAPGGLSATQVGTQIGSSNLVTSVQVGTQVGSSNYVTALLVGVQIAGSNYLVAVTESMITNALGATLWKSISGNAATATTASGVSGVLTIGNLPPFVITNNVTGFTNLGSYLGFGNMTNNGNFTNSGMLLVNGNVGVGGTFTLTGSSSQAGSAYFAGVVTGAYFNFSPAYFKVPNNSSIGFTIDGNYYSAIGAWFTNTSPGTITVRTNLAAAGYGSFTNGFGVLATNVAPTGPVSIGVTAPDSWIAFTNAAGLKFFMPAWLNH